MYLVLSPQVTKRVPVHHQSLGREITVFTNLESLKQVSTGSRVFIIYDTSLDFQKVLDLHTLLNIQFEFIVNDKSIWEMVKDHFKTHLLDYVTIDGSFIRALKLGDSVALESMQRDSTDRFSIHNKLSYREEVEKLLISPSITEVTSRLAENYLSLFAAYIQLTAESGNWMTEFEKIKRENFEMRNSISKMSSDVKTFLATLVEVNNKHRALVALSVLRENAMVTLPQHIASIHFRDYGIPNVFYLLSALYDALTVHYKKHTKVVYIGEPDGIDVNRIPKNYCILDEDINQGDLIKYDYFGCIGSVKVPLELLFQTSALNTIIICDARRSNETLFQGETLHMNLAPDLHTVKALNLYEEITITPSHKSKYVLRDEVITQETMFGAKNAKLVSSLINTLLDRRGEA